MTEPRALEWRHRAACRGAPDVFHGQPNEHKFTRDRREHAALAYCAECPVVRECFELARATADRWAVLGGTTPAERSNQP